MKEDINISININTTNQMNIQIDKGQIKINFSNDNINDKLISTASRVKMLLVDCDGVMTDGGMYYSEFGDELKKFNTRDGMGLNLLNNRGIFTGVITGENIKK
jgi:hypothetical protein